MMRRCFGLVKLSQIVTMALFSVSAQAKAVVTWGMPAVDTTSPAGLVNVVAIDGGDMHTIALQRNGKVVVWGNNDTGQKNVPPGLAGVVAISSGAYHNLALKRDGTVVAWGWNEYGQATVPAGLTDVVGIAGGRSHSVALKRDGTVVAWGNNDAGQTNVPAGLRNVVAIASHLGNTTLALESDGTVVAWGANDWKQAEVPPGLTNIVAIAAGAIHNLALRSDGTVVAWGSNYGGQAAVPPSLADVIAIAAGNTHSLALKRDGAVVSWGTGSKGLAALPSGLTDVVAIGAGGWHSSAVRAERPQLVPQKITRTAGTWTNASQIATVARSEFPATDLILTVNNGADATSNGVTLFSPAIDASGRVTAGITTSSAAGNANFVLRATDPAGRFSESEVNVFVAPEATQITAGLTAVSSSCNITTTTTYMSPSEVRTDAYSARITTSGVYQIGRQNLATVTLCALGVYRINDNYPYKFKVDDPAPEGISYPKAYVTRQAVDSKTTTFSVPFIPTKPGRYTIGGTLYFSVISDWKAILDKVPLHITIDVK